MRYFAVLIVAVMGVACNTDPEIDIEIVFTGKRPGEKLFEQLSSEREDIGDTAHPKIGIWKQRTEDWSAARRGIQRLMKMADSSSNGALQAELEQFVPEYTPDHVSTGERERRAVTCQQVQE